MVELLCIVVVCKYLVHWVIAGSVAKSVHSYVFSEQNKTKKKEQNKKYILMDPNLGRSVFGRF